MDVFLLVGLPFMTFLVPVVWAAYGVGGSGADPFAMVAAPTGRARIRRAALALLASLVAGLGAMAAATANAFGRTTDAGLAVEPVALLFGLEALVDLALVVVVARPGWSNRRAWLLRMAGVYWLCLAAPIWILADAGPGWLSTGADGIYFLGLPAFIWETIAALAPVVLLWVAAGWGGSQVQSVAGSETGADAGTDAGTHSREG